MQETKALFIIKKYRSILRAAIIVEAVNFIVSLTDGIIAGNVIGAEAFAAIGLLAPFLSISTFLSSIVNTGTVLNFSYQIGKINKHRANGFFSQGIILALLTGLLYALVLALFGSVIIKALTPSEEIEQYLRGYYYIILAFFFLQPVSFLLDNLLVADGGENLSVIANIILIISNVAGSLIFVGIWDIKGIAIATVLSRLLFILIACLHFFSRKNTLRFVRRWEKEELFQIFKSGIVKASTYGLEAVLTFSINLFAMAFFSVNTLVILVVVERFLGLMTLFIGLSMACQPLIGTLQGEKNTKAQYQLMKTALRDMVIVGAVLTVLTRLGARVITALFGIPEGEVFNQAVMALQIVSCTLILQAVLVLFFIYYVAINKQALAFIICLIKNFISPVVIAEVLAIILGSEIGIWIGLGAAPILAIIVSVIIVLLKHGRESFPFLISEDPEQSIFIYDFMVDSENAVKMAQTVGKILEQHTIPPKTCGIASVITEETIMLIMDKNKSARKPVHAECTLITQPDGVKLILRDSGVIFDLTDTDGALESFRQYIVSSLMLNQENKLYLITTGYNRSVFFFHS